jgi:hypothetical protein
MNSNSLISTHPSGPRARRWHMFTGSVVLSAAYVAALIVLDWFTR